MLWVYILNGTPLPFWKGSSPQQQVSLFLQKQHTSNRYIQIFSFKPNTFTAKLASGPVFSTRTGFWDCFMSWKDKNQHLVSMELLQRTRCAHVLHPSHTSFKRCRNSTNLVISLKHPPCSCFPAMAGDLHILAWGGHQGCPWGSLLGGD